MTPMDACSEPAQRRVKLFEVTDEGGVAKDWIAAYTAEDALEYMASQVHDCTVRDARVEGLISIEAPRELTDEDLDSMESQDEDSGVVETFRQGLAACIAGGRTVPFHFTGTE